jgi:hypothetical protein
VKDNKPAYAYNYLGLQMFNIVGATKLSSGKSTIKLEFSCGGGTPGSGGLIRQWGIIGTLVNRAVRLRYYSWRRISLDDRAQFQAYL